MEMKYNELFEMLTQAQNAQTDDFRETLNTINDEQAVYGIRELINLLSQKDQQYTTYSHV